MPAVRLPFFKSENNYFTELFLSKKIMVFVLFIRQVTNQKLQNILLIRIGSRNLNSKFSRYVDLKALITNSLNNFSVEEDKLSNVSPISFHSSREVNAKWTRMAIICDFSLLSDWIFSRISTLIFSIKVTESKVVVLQIASVTML